MMKRKPAAVGIVAEVATFLIAAALGVMPAAAQEVTGVLGSPSATTTIEGNQIPGARAEIRRRDQGKRRGLEAVVAADHRAAQGCAQHPAHHDRRPGLWRQRHVRRRHPDAGAGPHREGGAALHAVQLHRAVLAHARGADHRPQPPLGGFRRDHRAVHGFPGYDSIIGPDNATIGRILKDNGYATSWFGKNHNTPAFQYTVAGPFDQWPSGMGFDYFYGFMGGETDQWTPYLFQNNKQIFPWIGKPGYNLTTDMADEAISYMKELNAAAPDKPFFVYYVPGGSHSPHQPKKEWSRQVQGQVRHGLERPARADLRQPETLGGDSRECEADRLAGQPAEVGNAVGRREEAVRPASRGVRGLHGLYRPRDRPRHPAGRGHGQARQHADHLHRR